ncbi:MAG: CBS domain-containing protein, partial [Chloroflexi bacterium]
MPFQVQQIIQGKSKPVCVKKEDPAAAALSLMIEHDYSQIPVARAQDGQAIPEGMVTYEGILRAVRNFRARIDDLKVRDVMVAAPIHDVEDDLFDILDRLKATNAVLIVSGESPDLVGIVTSYDSTEYFRGRTEDLMRVEDIEIMIKELILTAYTNDGGEIDQPRLAAAIARVTGSRPGGDDRKHAFDDLTLSDYIMLLIYKETWPFFEDIFKLPRDAVNQLLGGVREVRNALAHFRKVITADERDRLRFAADWLNRCQEEFLAL